MRADIVFRWLMIGFLVILMMIFLTVTLFGTFANLEKFIRSYSGTIISLGTLAAVSMLALLTTHLSNVSASNREATTQNVLAELEVAKFRQAWINEMRDDLSELLRLSFHSQTDEDVSRAYLLHMKIEMRLNTKEELANKLASSLSKLSGKGLNSEPKNDAALAEVTLDSKNYLQNEWARLKSDIRMAKLSERSAI